MHTGRWIVIMQMDNAVGRRQLACLHCVLCEH